MIDHAIVSRERWREARWALLLREKEETRLRDAVRAERLALPWTRVDADYRFETPVGSRSLADLFAGRGQLVIYHFMLGPGWDAGCDGCSFLADHLDGTLPHLNNHDVTLAAVSRAPLPEIEAYRQRMGWRFPWASSHGSSFNEDFHVSFTEAQLAGKTVDYNFASIPVERANSELPGLSAFYRDDQGIVYHTYSTYARGPETLIGTLMVLDFAPKGRNEDPIMSFVKRHDEYADATAASCCGGRQ